MKYEPSELRKMVQKPKRGRKTSGESTTPFHDWRVANFLSQRAAAVLLGVSPTTVQKWDTIWESSPPLLEAAMRFHHVMRQEVDAVRNLMDSNQANLLGKFCGKALTPRSVVEEFQSDQANAPLIENLKLLGPAGKQALTYGVEHGLFGRREED